MAVLLSGALLFVGPSPATAESAKPELAIEAWWARHQTEAFPVDTCPPPTPTTTFDPFRDTSTRGCGEVGTVRPPAPQGKDPGHYVVASAGGNAGDGTTGADTAWAGFEWDLLNYVDTGITVTKFEVTLSQGSDNNYRNRGDTWEPGQEIFIQACNALEGFAGDPAANPWDTRPKPENRCVTPKINGRLFTFDVTGLAQSWVEGKGFGIVIKPGTPTTRTELKPFQITFSGTYDMVGSTGCSDPTQTQPCTFSPPPAPRPSVVFEFIPAPEDDEDIDDAFDLDTGDEFFEDITTTDGGGETLEALPDLDVIPTDVGSEPLPEDVAAVVPTDTGGDVTGTVRARRASADVGFPWIALLLLPLAAAAFWTTGTALGPMGDPVPTRAGGVSRVLAQRQAASGGSAFDTRNR